MKLKFLILFAFSISFVFIFSCSADEKAIEKNSSNLIHIQLEGDLAERRLEASGYEAITFVDDSIYLSIESINGDESTSYIMSGVIDFEERKITFPNIEYRITDATCVDSIGKFFAINYFYPGGV